MPSQHLQKKSEMPQIHSKLLMSNNFVENPSDVKIQ